MRTPALSETTADEVRACSPHVSVEPAMASINAAAV
jgi:hypothetical protein